MKGLFVALVICALLPTAGARADDFSDFRIPAHRLSSLTSSFSLQGYRNRSAIPEQSSRTDQLLASLFTSAEWKFDSDDLLWSLSPWVGVGGSRGTQHYGYSYAYYDEIQQASQTSRSRGPSEALGIAASLRRYPWEMPLGLEISGRASTQFDQNWTDAESEQLTVSATLRYLSRTSADRESWYYRYAASVTVAAGLGRVRDATGVYDAYLLESRLLETGVLTRALSPSARARLASLFYVRADFNRVRDRPDKLFWREVEQVMQEDGALAAGGLDAYGVLRATEPYWGSGTSFIRQTGVFAGLALTGQHLHYIRRSDLHESSLTQRDTDPPYVFTFFTSDRQETSDDVLLIGPQAEYHRPLGLRWQIDAEGSVQFPLETVDHGIAVNSSAGLRYLLADRWNLDLFLSQSRSILKAPALGTKGGADRWLVDYGLGIGYFLEDHVLIQLSARESQRKDRSYSRSADRTGTVNLGLAYRFLGNFDAPGLMGPARGQGSGL